MPYVFTPDGGKSWLRQIRVGQGQSISQVEFTENQALAQRFPYPNPDGYTSVSGDAVLTAVQVTS